MNDTPDKGKPIAPQKIIEIICSNLGIDKDKLLNDASFRKETGHE